MDKHSEGNTLLELAALHGKLLKRVDQSFMVHGISFTEFIVMYHLSKAPEEVMRRIDLAESVGLSASGVTRLLNPMQKIGLVKKEESARDARVSLVKLSAAGKKMFKDSNATYTRCAASFLQDLTDKERVSFAGIIHKLL